MKEFPNKKEHEIKKMMVFIEAILNPSFSHLVTVCRPTNGNAEIDVAILNALLKAKGKEKLDETKKQEVRDADSKDPDFSERPEVNQYQEQLRLALAWNRIDMARNFIFTDENKHKVLINLG